MQNVIPNIQTNSLFEKYVLDNLERINDRLKYFNPTQKEEYFTPNEVCKKIKISRGKFYQLVRDGFLTPFKLNPKGRKTLVSRSQLQNLFPKEF